MKKPNIEIEEFGAMGLDGFAIKIDGKTIATTKRLAFAESYVLMIDALMYLKGKATFYNSAIEMDHDADGERAEELINKALKKAGVELGSTQE